MGARFRRWAIVAAIAVMGVTGGVLSTGVGQQTRLRPTFEQMLIYGLEARRPSELAFIEAVVDTVNRGELPRSLVDRTFFWSRQRTPPRSFRNFHRPIIYFQAALTRQAARLRINIRESGAPVSN